MVSADVFPVAARTGAMGRPRAGLCFAAGGSGMGHSEGQASTGDGRATSCAG